MKHQGTVRLETDRLILRRFKEDDASSMYHNWANDDEVTRFLTWQTYSGIDNAHDFIRFLLDGYGKDDFYQWAIELKETEELIGSISVVRLDDSVDAAELGYCIGRRFWGHGYMTEAVRRVISFLFEEVGANRISARHDTNNPNSGKVMIKAGMSFEGTLRQCDRNNQGIVDCACYSILRSEYRKA